MTKPNLEPTQITTSALWDTNAALAIHAITTTAGTPGDAGVTSKAFDDRFTQRIVASVTKTGASSTVAQADSGKTALYTNAAQVAINFTASTLTVGSFFVLVALGAGGLKINTTTGYTFANSFTPKKTIAQGESLYVEVTAANTLLVIGGTSA